MSILTALEALTALQTNTHAPRPTTKTNIMPLEQLPVGTKTPSSIDEECPPEICES